MSINNGEDKDFKLRRIAECRCGRGYPFLSQRERDPDDPKYKKSNITLECECGCLITMIFPVN